MSTSLENKFIGINPYELPTKPLKQDDFSNVRACDWACPIICIDGALKAMNLEIDVDDLMWAACYDYSLAFITRMGMSISQMIRTLSRLGFEHERHTVYGSKEIAWRFLVRELKRGNPLIVFPPHHSVLVYGIDGEEVIYLEPDNLEEDYSKFNKDHFLLYWKGNQRALDMLVVKK